MLKHLPHTPSDRTPRHRRRPPCTKIVMIAGVALVWLLVLAWVAYEFLDVHL